jgi:hypothetical protein
LADILINFLKHFGNSDNINSVIHYIFVEDENTRKKMESLIVMKCHLDTCISDSIKTGQSDKKINELIDALYKFAK